MGIRPCTGAILVLVFALTQGLFWAGVAATFAMAVGTAITVAALATLALGSRELALRLGGANATWANAVWTVCTIGGALVIFLFGLLLFLASLGRLAVLDFRPECRGILFARFANFRWVILRLEPALLMSESPCRRSCYTQPQQFWSTFEQKPRREFQRE